MNSKEYDLDLGLSVSEFAFRIQMLTVDKFVFYCMDLDLLNDKELSLDLSLH